MGKPHEPAPPLAMFGVLRYPGVARGRREICGMKQDVVDIIIDAARPVFARFGFKKATLDDIARAAHKGKSSIYHYFESKAAVFQAVVEREGRLLRDALQTALEREDTPQTKLRAYIITRMEKLSDLDSYRSALRDEYLAGNDFIERMRADYVRDEVSFVKAILADGIVEGLFLVEDLKQTASAIVAALKSFEYPWATTDSISGTKKKVDVLLNVLLHGIANR